MSGSNPITIQLVRPFRQHTELKQRIAHHTRIRCTSLLIFVYEVFYNSLFKRYTFIRHIMFNAHPGSQLSGILRLISPHTHSDSHYFVSLFLQHKAGSGTVYTATHTHQHSLISFFHLILEKLHGYKCTRFQREFLLFRKKILIFEIYKSKNNYG